MSDTRSDTTIDITADICPITWVKTKLALEPLEAHRVLKVRLNGGEAMGNVPRSAAGEGHKLLRTQDNGDGTFWVWIEKRGTR